MCGREAGAFLAGLATSQAAKSITHLNLSRCADIIERDLVHLNSIPSLKVRDMPASQNTSGQRFFSPHGERERRDY
jgi:hypothetical protein